MTQPVGYVPGTAFLAFAPAGFPNLGTNLDTEFQNLKTTTDQIRTNLAILQRDDTNLANLSVTPDSLSALTRTLFATTGWTPRGIWLTATAYAFKDVVSSAGLAYVCITAHTSGVFATDLAAGKWLIFSTAYTTTAFGLSILAAADAAAALTLLGLNITAFAKTFLDDANAGAVLTTLGVTAFIQTLLDDVDAAAARVTLGVTASVNPFGKQTLWIPAAAMVARTTSGPASGTVELATNKVMVKTLDFDAAAQEFAQFEVQMPKSWNEGTVTAIFVWSHAATAVNFGVAWGIQGLGISDTEAQDQAFGTAVTVTDTGGTTNSLYRSAETAACTIGGTTAPAEGDVVIFQVYRDATAGADTLAIDARLQGVALFYTTNSADDT